MRNTVAVFKNQFNEFLSDKEVLLFFVMFPTMVFLQTHIMELNEGVYPYMIVKGMGSMFASAFMIMILPQLIAEHHENGSLRFMVMSGIKPISYLMGIGGFFLMLNMISATAFAWMGEFTGTALINFMLTMLLGTVSSILVAAIIGILSKNRQKAMGIALPAGMGLMFLPMLVNAFEPLGPILDLLYLGRLDNMMAAVFTGDFMMDVIVILVNIVVLGVIFAVLFKRKGLKS